MDGSPSPPPACGVTGCLLMAIAGQEQKQANEKYQHYARRE
jgi:hypothetical protein